MVELRTLTPQDWQLWREVRLGALADAPEAFGATLAYWSGDGDTEQRWRSRLRTVPLNLVALDGDRLTGQVSGTAPDAAGQVELISMWVAPVARGCGVADALVDAVVAWAHDLRATAVRLSVRRTNPRAIRLYARGGFVVTGEPGDEPAELTMVRQLTPDPGSELRPG